MKYSGEYNTMPDDPRLMQHGPTRRPEGKFFQTAFSDEEIAAMRMTPGMIIPVNRPFLMNLMPGRKMR